MKIIPLSEGSFTVDKTKVFVPFDEQKDSLSERPQGSLLVEVQPFVVVTDSDVLANPEDDRTAMVFSPGTRGSTDQVVYVFQKPL